MNEVLNKLKEINNKDIKIEQIGSWLWITGNTFKIKEELKGLGFFCSNNKKAWFYNNSSIKLNKSFSKTLEEIKNKYKTEEIKIF